MARRYADTITTDEALLWAKTKKILKTQGAKAAQEYLAGIRAEQALQRAIVPTIITTFTERSLS